MCHIKKILRSLWVNHEIQIRFILVGICNTILSYLIFVGFDSLFNLFFSPRYVAYMFAAVLSNIIAVTLAYFFHKHFTFKSQSKGKAAFLEYLRFYTTYIFTTILSLILLPLFVELLQLDPKIAAAIIMLFTAAVSFISHRLFSFRMTQ